MTLHNLGHSSLRNKGLFMKPVFAALLTVCAFSTAFAGPLEDREEASKLYKAGKFDVALTKVNSFLAVQPKDPQGRFIKGLILTEQRKPTEAIQLFTGLTEDFPELPEPYNNLAVLYASQGNYDKAKAALELAIHTHPSYATAHENLGDIYAQLARRAYDKALQLDKNNAAAQAKLSMVKDLFSASKAPVAPSSTPATQVAAANQAAAAPVKPAKSEPVKVEPVKPEPAKVEAPKQVAQAPAKTTPAEPAKVTPTKASSGNDGDVTAAVNAWAKAWSDKNVSGYLAAYAPEFETPDGLKRADWEQQRRERIEKPKSISVTVKINSVSVNGSEATVQLRQSYRSDSLKTSSNKTLKLLKSGDKWLIRQERVG
jgi:tetratricopeptide (TPR) repeat protein